MAAHVDSAPGPDTSRAAIFRVFLKLGLTSFGGPVAHLGYFRDEFVQRRRWLDDAAYADLVALGQFLPGPASSQVGFALGVLRGGGPGGGLAAWLGFTLPSFIVMLAFALGMAAFAGAAVPPLAAGVLHGLKLAAVAVVAQAVWGMGRSLAPDLRRALIALAALAAVLVLGGSAGQLLAIAGGALAGLAWCRGSADSRQGTMAVPIGRRAGTAALASCVLLLAGLPLLADAAGQRLLSLFDAFYRAGALVFGGGHVVLPLLQAETVATGQVTNDAFLAGYGVAQALPGPLFAFAAFLGAASEMAARPIAGAIVATCAVFLPGLLLMAGTLPFWDDLRRRPAARHALQGVNAAVVGILAAALAGPVWSGAVAGVADAAVALGGFLLLAAGKARPWIVVALLALAGALLGS